MSLPVVVVAFEPTDEGVKQVFVDALAGQADLVFVGASDETARRNAMKAARVIIVSGTKADLAKIDPVLFAGKMVQTMIAGVDQLPFDQLPGDAMIAHNGGAFAPQMAEHVVGMILAVKKDLVRRHLALGRGEWMMQAERTRELRGDTCAIIGFGGIGKATARLLRGFDVRIEAINRSGRTDEAVDFVGTLSALGEILPRADVVVLSLGLNAQTKGMIDAAALALMKNDATLVNVARGAVIDEAALFAHLKTTPRFSACLDTWWGEPFAEGKFSANFPFMDLPNVLGSPHNSGITQRYFLNAARHAVANVCRFLATGEAERRVTHADRP
ncbi:MAG: 2-hydroxyacid dehydrogenase [Proteobacteria bacterium]|nr:2-hydroxyacid dehydrogenase [Pseudomonadota bacterium]MDA1058835.1 2-hydroxyacid dehydrogenase [Pseudomonadota bacterium]